MKIGFLLNHEAPHQVGHAMPIALALLHHPRAPELRLLLAPGPSDAEARRLWRAAGLDGADPRLVTLAGPSRAATLATRASLGAASPLRRRAVLRRNVAHLRDLDALVVPEKTSLWLKTRPELAHLRLVHTRHGAGDRAVGFDDASGRFDLVLVSGPAIRDRLVAAGHRPPGGHAIVGYPKFDAPPPPPRAPLFADARPIILYNPHPAPGLSSWYRWGPAILRRLAHAGRYNIVFAPHVMLFKRRLTLSLAPPGAAFVPPVPRALAGCPNLHVDLGSPASIDMSYTEAAALYLGDASSQVYEFLRRPRPAVFLNPHRHDWAANPDFAHWQAGPVVAHLDELEDRIEQAFAGHARLRPVQELLFRARFDLDGRPSAERAAAAIVDFLDGAR